VGGLIRFSLNFTIFPLSTEIYLETGLDGSPKFSVIKKWHERFLLQLVLLGFDWTRVDF